MNKKRKIFIVGLLLSLIFILTIFKTNTLEGIVVNTEDGLLTVRDKNNVDYTFKTDDVNVKKRSDIVIEYRKISNKIVNYNIPNVSVTSEGVPVEYLVIIINKQNLN